MIQHRFMLANIGGERDAFLRRNLLQLLVGLAVVLNQFLAELLHGFALAVFLRQSAHLHFSHAALSGFFYKLLICARDLRAGIGLRALRTRLGTGRASAITLFGTRTSGSTAILRRRCRGLARAM